MRVPTLCCRSFGAGVCLAGTMITHKAVRKGHFYYELIHTKFNLYSGARQRPAYPRLAGRWGRTPGQSTGGRLGARQPERLTHDTRKQEQGTYTDGNTTMHITKYRMDENLQYKFVFTAHIIMYNTGQESLSLNIHKYIKYLYSSYTSSEYICISEYSFLQATNMKLGHVYYFLVMSNSPHV